MGEEEWGPFIVMTVFILAGTSILGKTCWAIKKLWPWSCDSSKKLCSSICGTKASTATPKPDDASFETVLREARLLKMIGEQEDMLRDIKENYRVTRKRRRLVEVKDLLETCIKIRDLRKACGKEPLQTLKEHEPLIKE